jgi:hypothetical protein
MSQHIDPTPGNAGYSDVGPRSIDGVEASDLPDKGRGSVDENIGKHLKRKTPDHLGGTPQETGGDVGIRATPDVADAADHRGHGKNAGI